MVSDAIESIKKKETEADELVRRARMESKKASAEAHEKAVAVVDEMRAGSRRDEQALLATARREAEAVAEKIAADSTTSVRATRERAESRIGEGVGMVLDSLTSG